MSSRDKKPTTSRSGNARIRTLSDLNRPSHDHDSDSDSDGPSEYYTGGEKSGMLVQDPTKGNKKKNIDAIFAQAHAHVPEEETPSSSSSSFTGTGRSLAGNYVQPPPQEPVPTAHDLVFWRNGFTVNGGPLRSIHDPENAAFLESVSRKECPAELDPGRGPRIPVEVNLTRREQEDYIEPETPFRGVGRTLGSSSVSPQPNTSPMAAAASTPSAGLIVDKSLPSTSIQLRLADGTRLVAHFNFHHTVGHIRSFINASRPGAARAYHLQTVGFPPKALNDDSQTIEQAGLANSVVIQKKP